MDEFILRNLVLLPPSGTTVQFSTFVLSQTSGGRRVREIPKDVKLFSEEEYTRKVLEVQQSLIIRFNKTAHVTIRNPKTSDGMNTMDYFDLIPDTDSLDLAVLEIFSNNVQYAELQTRLRSLPTISQLWPLEEIKFSKFVYPEAAPSGASSQESKGKAIVPGLQNRLFFVIVFFGVAMLLTVGAILGWRYRKHRSTSKEVDRTDEWDFDNDGISSIGLNSVVEQMMKTHEDEEMKKAEIQTLNHATSDNPELLRTSPRESSAARAHKSSGLKHAHKSKNRKESREQRSKRRAPTVMKDAEDKVTPSASSQLRSHEDAEENIKQVKRRLQDSEEITKQSDSSQSRQQQDTKENIKQDGSSQSREQQDVEDSIKQPGSYQSKRHSLSDGNEKSKRAHSRRHRDTDKKSKRVGSSHSRRRRDTNGNIKKAGSSHSRRSHHGNELTNERYKE